MAYRIEWKPSALREFRKLPTDVAAAIRGQVERLSATPRPPGCAKLAGFDQIYRARVGALGLWEQLTLAEALLLSGDMTGAIGEYRAAKARFPDSVGSIEKAIWQARIHSGCLDVQFPDTLD